MGEPRKHHYVPVFYQSNFANRNGLLWVYDREAQTCKLLHPDSICCQKDLYTVQPKSATPNRGLETKYFNKVDGDSSRALREFLAGQRTKETILILAYFIGVQVSRLPSTGKMLKNFFEAHWSETMRIIAKDPDRMRSVMARTFKAGEKPEVTPEQMVDAIKNQRIHPVANEMVFLNYIHSTAENLAKVILGLDWEIMIASEENGFMISDFPVVIVPPRGGKYVGFRQPNNVKYFPLHRCVCLRLGDAGQKLRDRIVSKETVRLVNYNMAANSDRFIIGPDKAQLMSVVRYSQSEKLEATPRFTMSVKGTDDDSMLMQQAEVRRYFYKDGEAP